MTNLVEKILVRCVLCGSTRRRREAPTTAYCTNCGEGTLHLRASATPEEMRAARELLKTEADLREVLRRIEPDENRYRGLEREEDDEV